MRVNLVGATGALGQAILRVGSELGHEVVPLIGDLWTIRSPQISAPVVINAAGLVDRRIDPSRLLMINGTSPHLLASACRKGRARLIHISTDAMFSQPGPHTEESLIGPITDEYTRSKLAGEVTYGGHLTLRTAFVGFGRSGLLQSLEAQRSIFASRRFHQSVVVAEILADLLFKLALRPEVSGLLHVPGPWADRYEIVTKLAKHFRYDQGMIHENDAVMDRRLASTYWDEYQLPPLPTFDEQILRLRRPEYA